MEKIIYHVEFNGISPVYQREIDLKEYIMNTRSRYTKKRFWRLVLLYEKRVARPTNERDFKPTIMKITSNPARECKEGFAELYLSVMKSYAHAIAEQHA